MTESEMELMLVIWGAGVRKTMSKLWEKTMPIMKLSSSYTLHDDGMLTKPKLFILSRQKVIKQVLLLLFYVLQRTYKK